MAQKKGTVTGALFQKFVGGEKKRGGWIWMQKLMFYRHDRRELLYRAL